jgi:membrane protease YdiL (CAAX protease family)
MDDFGFVLCETLGVQGVTWILIPIFLRLHRVSWREAFGLSRPGWWKSLLLAAGVMVFVLPLILLLQDACVQLLTWLGHPPENQKAVDMFLNAKTPFARGYFIVFAVILAPVAEEFIFRGVLYPFIKERGWPLLALFSVNALFALIHFDLATFFPLFVLALVLTWLYEQTNSLLASITAHSLFNAGNVVLLVFQPQVVHLFHKFLHVDLNQ